MSDRREAFYRTADIIVAVLFFLGLALGLGAFLFHITHGRPLREIGRLLSYLF